MADDKSWTKEKIKERLDENELDLSLCQISKVPVKFMVITLSLLKLSFF